MGWMGSELEAKVGKYEVISKLGEGGMGVVYKAKDPIIDRVVAIKKMTGTFADNAEARERFLREARAVGRLQHPNIVTIYEMGVEGNSPYMVMEFLEGQGLDKVISSRAPLPLLQKLEYMIQVCNALHFAHEHSIVHRDVKPANVIVLTGGVQVKLVDFGIARAGDSGMTRTGIAIGTTSYMSPEQIEASKGLDRRSDVFSAGVMMYEILTSSLPFPGSEPIAIAIKILREPYPPLSAYLSDYPPELDAILERALAKDRDERYSTAEEFAFELTQLQERLRKEAVGENLSKARFFYARYELVRARELLTEVIKAEPQHSEARRLITEVNQLIQKQERSAQVRDFRFAAEQAVGQDRFDDALGLIDQAIRVDKTDQHLAEYRELILQGLRRKEEVQKKLQAADSAEKTEDLQAAEGLVEEALELDPTDTQARMMMVALKRRLGQQSREAELSQLAELARKDIQARRFTGAHDVIRRLEAIDPTWTEIQVLKEEAVAERTREEEQRKFVDEQLAASNRLLTEGKLQEALGLLQGALKKYPQDGRLSAAIKAGEIQIKEAAAVPPPPPPQARTAATATRPMTAVPTRGAAPRTAAATAAAAPAVAPVRWPPVVVPAPSSKKKLVLAVLAAVLVIGAGVGGYMYWRARTAAGVAGTTATTTAPGTVATGPGFAQINASPWGSVKSITAADGKAVEISEADTPVRIELAPGVYEIVMTGPDGSTEKRSQVTVKPAEAAFVNFEFQQVNAKKIVDSY
jgi:serine/threonine-protein kinase